jgi:hypothetical protein
MLRRFLLGLIEGLVIGLALAVASARGLGLATPGRVTAAVLAGAVGFLVGLVAGRPVWARDAKTEALLKAGVGALVGAGLSLALGHWLAAPVDLSQFALGAGPVGKLPAVSLPAIACALSLFFELDDTSSRTAPARVAAPPAQKRQTLPANDDAELAELAEPSDDSRSKLEKR